jgi:hypothetical protein
MMSECLSLRVVSFMRVSTECSALSPKVEVDPVAVDQALSVAVEKAPARRWLSSRFQSVQPRARPVRRTTTSCGR